MPRQLHRLFKQLAVQRKKHLISNYQAGLKSLLNHTLTFFLIMLKIIVRLCKSDKEPIVFIPSIPANKGRVMSWQPVGQHGEADINFYRFETIPAGDKAEEIAIRYQSEIMQKVKVIPRLITANIGKRDKFTKAEAAEAKASLIKSLDVFTRHYIIAALWSSNDESDESGGNPMDDNYSIEDLSIEALQECKNDCETFQIVNRENLRLYYEHFRYSEHGYRELAGHDFWLTRNRHGVGFWDRGLPDDLGERLTEASHKFKECHPYIGDDGQIYIE